MVAAVGAAVALPPAVARAQSSDGTTGTSTATLTGSDLTLSVSTAAGVAIDDDTLKTFFSTARCACPTNLTANVALVDGAAAKLGSDTLDVTLMLGSDCNDTSSTSTCVTVATPLTLSANKVTTSGSFGTGSVFTAAVGSASCTALPASSTRLWAIAYFGGARVTGAPSLALGIGGAPPDPPTAVTVETADSGLLVSWKAASDSTAIAGYQVLCSPGAATASQPAYETCSAATPASGDGGTFATLDPSLLCSGLVAGTSFRVHGLDNGRTYDIAVIAIGTDLTPSAASAVVQGVPGPTLGFDDLYKQSGGAAQAGCAVAGGPGRPGLAALLILGTSVLLVRRRRRGTRIARLVVAGLALAATPARADWPDDLQLGRAGDPETSLSSPHKWNLELRFGPYRPSVDSEPGLTARPFEETFGPARHLMMGLEIDRQLLHRGGTLALGVGAGYYSVSARALSADQQTRSGDETALRLIPLSLSLVFRADELYRQSGFPLVPYGKAGLDCTLWSISDTAKPSSTDGYTLGWHAAAGLALMLGFLDPESTRSLDQESGVNDIALFFEVARYADDGLGRANQLHVGDTTWLAGLMLEL